MTSPITPLISEEEAESVLNLINDQKDAIDTLQAQVIVLTLMRDHAQSELLKLLDQNDASLKRIADLEEQLAAAQGGQPVTPCDPLPEIHLGNPLPRGMRIDAGFRIV
jgi:hypothetical protein